MNEATFMRISKAYQECEQCAAKCCAGEKLMVLMDALLHQWLREQKEERYQVHMRPQPREPGLDRLFRAARKAMTMEWEKMSEEETQ